MNPDELSTLTYQQQSRYLKEADSAIKNTEITRNIKILVGFIIIITCLMMYGCPQYNVWQQGLAGEAELKRATQNRQVKIEEAKAASESAEYFKNAEIIRAEGVKKANDIVQTGLGGPEGYLRYLFINGMNESNCDRVYVPTETMMPITEASALTRPRG